MTDYKPSQYILDVKAHAALACLPCRGLGTCDDAEFGGMGHSTWTCETCKGTGYRPETRPIRQRHIPQEVRDWLMRLTRTDGVVRVGGDVVCDACSRTYHDHPEFHPTFHLLCDGRIGKT